MLYKYNLYRYIRYNNKKEIERPSKDSVSAILPSTMNVIYIFQNVERISSSLINELFNSIL
jgi:hypothetical protein